MVIPVVVRRSFLMVGSVPLMLVWFVAISRLLMDEVVSARVAVVVMVHQLCAVVTCVTVGST